MMQRTIKIILENKSKSLSFTTVRWTSTETLTKKEQYYKEMGTKQDDSLPADWDKAKPFNNIPGPKPIPILGNMWRFLPLGDFYKMQMSDLYKKLNKQYGDVVAMRGLLGVGDMILIFDPADIETKYRNAGAWPYRLALESIYYYRSVLRRDLFQGVNGVLNSQGEEWFKFRSIINPILMKPQNVKMYVGGMDTVAQELVGNIRELSKRNKDGEMPEDFLNELYKWALESMGVIALDRHLGCLKLDLEKDSLQQKHIDNVIGLFHLVYKLDILPSLWRWISTPDWRKFVKCLDHITDTSVKYVDEAIDQFNKNGPTNDTTQQSVLQQLIKIDKKVAVAMVLDMLNAGIDTTGRTLGAVLYFLAKNPEKQKKLQEELLKFLPSKDSPVTNQVLENCVYAKAVIKESMRLAPLAAGNMRRAQKNIVLGGYQIPKGTDIISVHLAASTAEKNFKYADKFIPERWLRSTEGEMSVKNSHLFASMPFGFGPRSCVGQRLANLEMNVGLIKILRNFELSWPHEDIKMATTIFYGIAGPLKLHVKELDK